MGEMIMASNFAGIAFGNAGVGAVHALSYPLGGTYHVPHGEANYQFFTEIFKLYRTKAPKGTIETLEGIVADILRSPIADVYDNLDKLLSNLLQKKPLKEYGMTEADIDLFTENVIATQQRLLANNYTSLTKEDIRNVYKKLF